MGSTRLGGVRWDEAAVDVEDLLLEEAVGFMEAYPADEGGDGLEALVVRPLRDALMLLFRDANLDAVRIDHVSIPPECSCELRLPA